MSGDAGLLRGVDRAGFAVAFGQRLRDAGMPVGLTAVQDLVSALAVCPPVRLPALYWTARLSLVRRQPDLATFDAVFATVFGAGGAPSGRSPPVPPVPRAADDAMAPVPAGHDEPQDGSGLPWATLPPVVAETGDDAADGGLLVPHRLASGLGGLADEPFEALDAAQVERLGAWLREVARHRPTRRTRRHTVDRAGRRIALRPTLARSRRTGWEPIQPVRERPVRRPRRVVLLCDVSRSMQAQAAAYLHLMQAFTVVADAEVFAFAARLTRLTAILRRTAPAVAAAAATEAVNDRFCGTRIAANLAALLSSRHGDALRGAVVVVASDGWDSDPPGELAAAMARTARRAHRVIWINPRAGAPGFEPRVAALAAALPYCDAMLPAGTFASLAAVVAEVCAGDTRGDAINSRSRRAPTGGTVPR